MAMSPGSFKSRMVSELESRGFILENSVWMDDFLDGISQAIYDEITVNARATGSDSNGDSHSLEID